MSKIKPSDMHRILASIDENEFNELYSIHSHITNKMQLVKDPYIITKGTYYSSSEDDCDWLKDLELIKSDAEKMGLEVNTKEDDSGEPYLSITGPLYQLYEIYLKQKARKSGWAAGNPSLENEKKFLNYNIWDSDKFMK